jgi:cytidylate kinase
MYYCRAVGRIVQDGGPASAVDDAVRRLPLYQALDAPCLDTTSLTVSQVADRVQEMISAGIKRT